MKTSDLINTGSKILKERNIPTHRIDSEIKREIPKANNIFNYIGKTSLEEYFALSYYYHTNLYLEII